MLDNIKRIAKEKGVTLTSIEEHCDFKNIYRWDKNSPSIDKVEAVAKFLGVTVDELLK